MCLSAPPASKQAVQLVDVLSGHRYVRCPLEALLSHVMRNGIMQGFKNSWMRYSVVEARQVLLLDDQLKANGGVTNGLPEQVEDVLHGRQNILSLKSC